MQRWLCPASIADDLERCIAECVDDSCKWFQDSRHYGLLTSNRDSYTIRIVGRPCEGKTTLSSWIMNKIQCLSHMRVLCFFCKAGDAEKRLAVHVIRTLLSHLSRLHDDGISNCKMVLKLRSPHSRLFYRSVQSIPRLASKGWQTVVMHHHRRNGRAQRAT